nr:MAG TPA: hypothetical protein [Caudoviricetes sp.]
MVGLRYCRLAHVTGQLQEHWAALKGLCDAIFYVGNSRWLLQLLPLMMLEIILTICL